MITFENITLKKANIMNAPYLNRWWNDGAVMAHAGFPKGLGLSMGKTQAAVRAWEKENGELFIIEIDGRKVGECSYRLKDSVACPGWKICERDYQNKGYGTKIILNLFHFLFQKPGIQKICLDTMIENKRAQHVYENKIGAKRQVFKKMLGKTSWVIYAVLLSMN